MQDTCRRDRGWADSKPGHDIGEEVLMLVRRWRIGILMGLAAAIAPLSMTSADAAVSAPHIKAQPNNVMVNTSIALTGVRFPAHSTFTIKECSMKAWIAPQNPCSANNSVSVTTNSRGRFRASM